jgi:hypothetical protein
MRLVVKKLEIADLGQLESLVMEHLDEIEPGLTVLDSRLLLGHATVDIVALDAEGSLVLTVVGFTADEEMLLKAVEAYSWCLEYPDAIRRLFPSVDISAARPPRLMFVVERLPDAFHRKIKQLGFSEIDCVEFRHLDVSGTPAAYFDTIARLRRGGAAAEPGRQPIVRRAPERCGPEPIVAERSVATAETLERTDKVVPIAAPIPTRATSVRLQKMLNTNGHGPSNGAVAPVIEITARTAATPAPRVEAPEPRVEAAHVEVTAPRVEPVRAEPVSVAASVEVAAPRIETSAPRRARAEAPPAPVFAVVAAEAPAPVPAPRVEAPAPVIEPVARVTLREAVAVPAPAAVAPAAAPAHRPQAAEARVSFAEIAKELLGAPIPGPRAEVPAVIPRPAVEEITRATLEDIAAAAAEGLGEPEAAIALEEPPAEVALEDAVAELIAEPVAEPTAEATAEPIVELEPEPAPEPVVAPVLAAPAPVATPAPPPAPVPAPVAAPAPAAPPAAPGVPQQFEGLKFPNDGVLTRQWMEFLNQMAASK